MATSRSARRHVYDMSTPEPPFLDVDDPKYYPTEPCMVFMQMRLSNGFRFFAVGKFDGKKFTMTHNIQGSLDSGLQMTMIGWMKLQSVPRQINFAVNLTPELPAAQTEEDRQIEKYRASRPQLPNRNPSKL